MSAIPGNKVILIVDDDEAIGELLKDLLNAEPAYHALVSANAEPVPELFQQVRIDLLLLDVNLPGMDGIELYDVLQHDPRIAQTPVLFMTAIPQNPRLVARHPIAVLAKPFDLGVVLACVGALLLP
jgi:DNA-binding response OmpR family regulator